MNLVFECLTYFTDMRDLFAGHVITGLLTRNCGSYKYYIRDIETVLAACSLCSHLRNVGTRSAVISRVCDLTALGRTLGITRMVLKVL